MWGLDEKKKRKGFSQSQKLEIIHEQDNRCAKCPTKFSKNVKPHFDHKNGDRSDNRTSNGQALCPNCHDNKSRKENKARAKKPKNEDLLGFGKMNSSSMDAIWGKPSKTKSNVDSIWGTKKRSKKKSKKDQDNNPFGDFGNIGF